MPDYPVKNGAGADIVTGYDVDANPPTKRDYSGDYPVKNGLGQTVIASPPANTRTLPARPATGAQVVNRYPVKDGNGNTILSTGGGSPALSGLKSALTANNRDVTLLVIGDSTGDSTTEWVYRVAQALAGRYPTHSVDYALFDSTNDVYPAATSISTGTGAYKLQVRNASLGGANLNTWRGSKFAPAIANLTPDLIVSNLGQNTTGLNATPEVQIGNFMALAEQVMFAHPGKPLAFMLQNPRRDTDLMAPVTATLRALQARYPELALIDVYADFVARGKAADLYLDDVHPSSNAPGTDGTTLYVNRFMAELDRASGSPAAGAFIARLTNRAAKTLAINGDFAAFSGSVPDGWVLQGAGAALTKDTAIKAPGRDYSVKLVNGSAASHLRQAYASGTNPTTFNALKAGGKATIAILHRISSGGPPSNGTGRTRLLVEPPASSGAVQDNAGVVGLDGWRWDIIAGVTIPADLTLAWLMDYANTAAGLGIGTVNISEMHIFVGDIPGGP